MNLLQKFQFHLADSGFFHPADELLIAISGGVDSVVLTHLLHASGYTMHLAHMNFGLRGAESERDEQFVRDLAGRYSLPLSVQKANAKAYASDHHCGIQEAARTLRYQWFGELIAIHPTIKYLCTAHHADDNMETVLMNLFRGTGISGMRGIEPRQDKMIRPLLFASRKEIDEYARTEGIGFVEDSSNKEEKYTRNFFRLQVIPMVEKVYPAAAENMRRNISKFIEVELLYREMVELKRKKLVVEKNGEWHIPVEKLRHAAPLKTIIYEVFYPFGFSSAQVDEIISLMDSETGRLMLSATHRLLKNRNWFIISVNPGIPESIAVVDKSQKIVEFSQGKLTFTIRKYSPGENISNDPMTAIIDTSAVEYPLIVRPWKTGDYFYPLGMRKKKKLSRFFIDRKLSASAKNKTWVIESLGRIWWVIGQRIDDRCKVGPGTTSLTCIRWEPKTG